jgi:hypothetical protein
MTTAWAARDATSALAPITIERRPVGGRHD